MRILVACERSGHVRDALLARGHDATSCDTAPSDNPGPHICGRAEDALDGQWDMIIGFPPCTYLSNAALPCVIGKCSHVAHDETYREYRGCEMLNAALLFHALRDGAPLTAIENPQPHPEASRLLGRHTARTEPFWFGHPWRKRTLWWLKGLQPLHATNLVTPTHRLVNSGSTYRHQLPGLSRDPLVRSETPTGLAQAIATQWPYPQTLFT